MPIYEYVCPNCDFKFELLRPLSQACEAVSCPRCQQSAGRVLSSFASFSMGERGLVSLGGKNYCAGCVAKNCATCNT